MVWTLGRDSVNSSGYINKAFSASTEVSLSLAIPLLT